MEVICKWCGSSFETEKKKQIYCSDICRNEANKAAKQRYRGKTKDKKKKIKVCKWCGKEFVADYVHRNYCSEECSHKAKLECIKNSPSQKNKNKKHATKKKKDILSASQVNRKKHVTSKLLVPTNSKIMDDFRKEHHCFKPIEGDNYLSHQQRQLEKTMALYGRVKL